jgi:hypothetical protein
LSTTWPSHARFESLSRRSLGLGSSSSELVDTSTLARSGSGAAPARSAPHAAQNRAGSSNADRQRGQMDRWAGVEDIAAVEHSTHWGII